MYSEKTHLIELKLREISQLFNSMDPSPFHEKDLDHDAEEFIVSWAQEYSSKDSLKLRIHLEQPPATDPTEMIQRAVHHYFSYRSELAQMEFKHLMKLAQKSLLIGSMFLGLCLFGSNVILNYTDSALANFFKEGLTIVGWVAMWRPIQLYLYDWWPVYNQIGIYRKLGRIPVEVVQNV